MSTKFTSTKPFIVMMFGFPGAGKTAFARQLSEELGLIHLQEDKIRHDLFGNSDSPGVSKGTRKVMNYMSREFMKTGLSVVYDASVVRTSERRLVREMALECKAKPLLIWLQVDPETTFARTHKRDKRKADDKYAYEYDEQIYREILEYMQNPTQEDYIVVSGKHTFVSQRSTVVKKLYDLGVISPEVAGHNVVKPELVNLVPTRAQILNRNISIR